MTLLPIILTTLAGASTFIGGFIGIITKKPSDRLLAFSLGFAAGIMLLISLMEMLPAALQVKEVSPILCYSAFVAGLICYFILDRLLPHYHAHDFIPPGQEQHERCHPEHGYTNKQVKLKRTAVLLTLGISLHNFPEGIATFITTSTNWELGLGVAIAIALHNIPEGLAVSVPVYMATGSKWQALLWSCLSGAAEILGGFIAFFILGVSGSTIVMTVIMAAVAGIMVALSIDELIPLAREVDPQNNPSVGVLCGMVVMGFSLILLQYYTS